MKNSMSAVFRWFSVGLLFLTLSSTMAGAAPIILSDHRSVGIEGFVVHTGPNEFTSVNERKGLTHPGAIGSFNAHVNGGWPFMNSHAQQTSSVFPSRPFHAEGKAQAQYRNFDCCPVSVYDYRMSDFSAGTEFEVTFQIANGEKQAFNLQGEIGVVKGMWSLENPLSSFLSVSVILASRIGGPNGVFDPLFSLELTEADLFNPDCLLGSVECNAFYLPEFRTPFSFNGVLGSGYYTLIAAARADSMMPRTSLRTTEDGSAWFNVTFAVPEPPTLPLIATLVILAASVRRKAGLACRGTPNSA